MVIKEAGHLGVRQVQAAGTAADMAAVVIAIVAALAGPIGLNQPVGYRGLGDSRSVIVFNFPEFAG